jgi:tetratricopeptide (TPR) repeat protein
MNLSQVNMLVEQALSAYQSKSFADAEELWAAAGKLCAAGEQWIGVASCRLNRGNSLANLGRFAEAIAEFDRAEPIFVQFQSEIGAAGCRISRGDALANLRRFDEAISEFDEAEAVFALY